jgi:3-hydroxyacyl-[acyl-carrier-protein] dehydratase
MLNNFYSTKEINKEDNRLQAIIQIFPGHEIFNGHFPDQPVVPGVCMIQIVKEFLEQASGQKLLLHKGNQLKFLQLIVPSKDENIQVTISWTQAQESYTVNADFKRGAETAFKLSGIFTVV